MKIFIPGCAGYIGSVLVPHLLGNGHEVVGLDNLYYDNFTSMAGFWGHERFTFIYGDVRETTTCLRASSDCDAVVWLAALVGAPICDADPKEAQEVNHNAAVAFAGARPTHMPFLYPCTNSGYGQCQGQVTEESPMNPVSLYGKTKVEAEKKILSRKSAVSLRLATVFGVSPRMRFDLLVNDWTERITRFWDGCEQTILSVYQPSYRRNFVHVRDVCRAVSFALGNSLEGVYNVGLPSANLTKGELANAVCDALNLPRNSWRVGEGEDPDARDYLVSNEKILSLGFSFQFGLWDGVKEVAGMVKHTPRQLTRAMRNV